MSTQDEDTQPAVGREKGAADLPAGQRIGRFVILDRLGQGGMAVVYAAYDPELDRKVALKVLRPSQALGGDGRARLLREAQALARVTHANVAVIYDAGVFEDTLFLAQELIDGGTLETWLQQPRGWREIVHMFVLAGRGLAAAHTAGLVHRDFKPANVLIGTDGRVRVTDFGLARAVDESGPAGGDAESSSRRLSEAITRAGVAVGTPLYMSPEQHRGRPEPRSDQFSFCVALFMALFGEHPFGEGTLMARTARALGNEVQAPATAGRAPARLLRLLMRGLAADPGARFPSMAALLVELERDPARARRRVARAAALLGAIGLATAGGWLLHQRRSAAQSEMCRRGAAQLAGAWDDARRSAVRRALAQMGAAYAADAADRVAGALDEWSAAFVAMHEDACLATRVRGVQSAELLDRRMACLGARREELAALVEVLAHADAQVASKAVQAARSLTPVSSCAAATLLAGPPPPPAAFAGPVAEARARLAQAKALIAAGRFAAAEEIARQTVAALRPVAYLPAQADAAYRLAQAQSRTGDYAGAEASLFAALAAAQASHHDELAARATIDLVFVIGYSQRRVNEGRRLAPLAEAAVARLGGDHPELAAQLEDSIGSQAFAEGKYDVALERFQRALALRERSLPPGAAEIASSHNMVGNAYEGLGRNVESAAELEQAIAGWQRALGPSHPELAKGHANLGRVYLQLGRFADALAQQQRALALITAAYGPEHPIRANIESNLAEVHFTEGRYAEALASAQASLDRRLKVLGPDHADVAFSREYVADALIALGRPREARPQLEQALALWRKVMGEGHSVLAYPLTALARVELAEGAAARAVPLLERALALRAGVDPGLQAQDQALLARALVAARGDRARGLQMARLAAENFHRSPPLDDRGRRDQAELAAWLARATTASPVPPRATAARP